MLPFKLARCFFTFPHCVAAGVRAGSSSIQKLLKLSWTLRHLDYARAALSDDGSVAARICAGAAQLTSRVTIRAMIVGRIGYSQYSEFRKIASYGNFRF